MGATEIYSGDCSAKYHLDKRSIPAQALPWICELRAKKFQPHVSPDSVVFEYGVGYGWNLAHLSCRRKIGCDISPLLETEVQKLDIEFVYTAEEIPEATADVVICHHALEHLSSPSEALAQMHRILKPNGSLLLFVPYEKERRYRRFNAAEPNHHLFSWNVQTLGNLVATCGFTFVEGGLQKFRFDRFAARVARKLRIGRAGYFAIRSLALLIAPEYEIRLVAKKNSPRASL
ncbi:MAG: class I SAM-dependent methyltransferase [Limisphaerales bacterium]